jgi:transcriptional regulator with XRE-family HTH domain
MPPRNPPRSMTGEKNLADRIAFERELRHWSYEALAQRMTEIGCPMNQSAIYKIEKGEPRRRITVDELLAFAQVLELDVQELLAPTSVEGGREQARLWLAWKQAQQEADAALDRLHEARSAYERASPR